MGPLGSSETHWPLGAPGTSVSTTKRIYLNLWGLKLNGPLLLTPKSPLTIPYFPHWRRAGRRGAGAYWLFWKSRKCNPKLFPVFLPPPTREWESLTKIIKFPCLRSTPIRCWLVKGLRAFLAELPPLSEKTVQQQFTTISILFQPKKTLEETHSC